MTVFVLSHNLQVQDSNVPSLTPAELAEGLSAACPSIQAASALNHGHWMIRIEAAVSVEQLAQELAHGWLEMRSQKGHKADHVVMALGGRKDTEGAPGSPLEKGFWGVDVVESRSPDEFLQAINWSALKQARPEDAVFEVIVNAAAKA